MGKSKKAINWKIEIEKEKNQTSCAFIHSLFLSSNRPLQSCDIWPDFEPDATSTKHITTEITNSERWNIRKFESFSFFERLSHGFKIQPYPCYFRAECRCRIWWCQERKPHEARDPNECRQGPLGFFWRSEKN